MKSGRRPTDKPVIIRGLAAGFVPPTVYIGIPLFVLPKGCSGQLSSMPWRVRGTVVSCANKPVGAPSRPAAPPCAARPGTPVVFPGLGFSRVSRALPVYRMLRPEDNRISYPSYDRRTIFWAVLWKHEHRKSYVNRRRNRTRS